MPFSLPVFSFARRWRRRYCATPYAIIDLCLLLCQALAEVDVSLVKYEAVLRKLRRDVARVSEQEALLTRQNKNSELLQAEVRLRLQWSPVCMCVHSCVRVCVCILCVFVCVCERECIYIYACIYVCVCVHVCVYMYVCVSGVGPCVPTKCIYMAASMQICNVPFDALHHPFIAASYHMETYH